MVFEVRVTPRRWGHPALRRSVVCASSYFRRVDELSAAM
jgi:hypothetical protein